MQTMITFGSDHQNYQAALGIRKSVFIQEQGIDPAIEIDGLDQASYHLVAYLDGQAIACLRLRPLNQTPALKVQRLAVLKDFRQQGFGLYLLKACESWARQAGYQVLHLASQIQALPFYLKAGFLPTSKPTYYKAGIVHQDMTKDLL